MTLVKGLLASMIALSMLSACEFAALDESTEPTTTVAPALTISPQRLDIYQSVDLYSDLSGYSEKQKHMISLLIDAAKLMDDLFWQQAFGEDKDRFLSRISDAKVRHFASINYGPWDRLNNDQAFLTGYADKPKGAQFYPADMSKDEFVQLPLKGKDGLYSVLVRNEQGKLSVIPFSEKYAEQLQAAAELLEEAAKYAEDPEFANYLLMRAQAITTDAYQASDFAWMEMKNNPIDLVIGAIETYEDQLFGYRAAFEAYVLVKDLAWSQRLAKFAKYLPELQRGLPVADAYKAQMPGSNADLNAYDVIYYAGHANAGSKTIAINLPNDEEVQLTKGTRRLQLKNAMQAKFTHILVPIAEQLIVPSQRQHITFDAFFANTMFHEVAHGLGIKQVLNSEQTVRAALKEHASALEEGKADILGLYMVRQLLQKGVLSDGQLEDYYTTFLAGIFRSVRFGASSAHGRANMVRFNYFQEKGAFKRNQEGQYAVNMTQMNAAIDSLSELILTLQGDGNYQGVAELVAKYGVVNEQLEADLARLTAANIPVDIHFNQGKAVLGLN